MIEKLSCNFRFALLIFILGGFADSSKADVKGGNGKTDSLVVVTIPKDSSFAESRAFQSLDFMTKWEVFLMI
ncbi:MAG: hypothetical protein JKX73_08370, partial [Flavobacteriales bacterium]|nr:hypothetical protein [Flavobacteriales bacterium]